MQLPALHVGIVERYGKPGYGTVSVVDHEEGLFCGIGGLIVARYCYTGGVRHYGVGSRG